MINMVRPNTDGSNVPSKITLEKENDFHIFQIKQENINDEIVVNLNWSQPEKRKSGFFGGLLGSSGGQRKIDLDLGCFYELLNGQKTVIDGLQFSRDGGPRTRCTRQGCYTQSPWIWHMGDDRSGSQMAAGEFILINPLGYKDIRRLTIYAYIYEGVSKWEQCDAVMMIKVPGNPDVVVELGQQQNPKTFCAIASLDFVGNQQIRVSKHVSFYKGHGKCDKAHNWGLSWGEGQK
jgi:tellurite resistance protein TerA